MTQAETTTPMMQQWQACKEDAKEALLLFRLGDFYEAFHEDAKVLAQTLDLTLTKRHGIPMSGIPWHASDGYIDRLIAKGHRVAIAEQTSTPKEGKGLVSREVVKILTPGSHASSSLLQEKANNFFASVAKIGSLYGLSFVDLTTGECFVMECEEKAQILSELYRIRPSECLLSEKLKKDELSLFSEVKQSFPILFSTTPNWQFDSNSTFQFLMSHFDVKTLDGFGLQGMMAASTAAGALLTYLQENLHHSIDHIKEMHPYSLSEHLQLDATTQRNLELTDSLQGHQASATLLSVIDQTQTSMGGRLLRKWLKRPLLSPEKISARQEAIAHLIPLLSELGPLLKQVKDLERLMMRITCNLASPRDLLGLAHSLHPIPALKTISASIPSPLIQEMSKDLNSLDDLALKITTALRDDPPIRISEGNLIRDGYNRELDEVRSLFTDSKNWLERYKEGLKESTGIKTLKVGYNKMFGFYIEVSKGQAEKAPPHFHRKQTLVNAERYITDELKEYESKVLNAEERAKEIETALFQKLREEVANYSQIILHMARALATIDTLFSLASVAKRGNWCKPKIDQSDLLQIKGGKHPVIAASHLSEPFVPNDTILNEAERLLVITGPNMAGKSTYIRQVALLTILAQIGSYLPAEEAHIGIIDRIFTRIGASDNLSRGQSTFMVEMTETANILHNATPKSLVILDEIGRGTSTYDGISIAWAVAEHFLTEPTRRAKTLFATHYFELTNLEEKVAGAVNYHVAVSEQNSDIRFLRKIIRGSADQSYGIHVAKLAGMPHGVLSRANDLLLELEKERGKHRTFQPKTRKKASLKKESLGPQLTLFPDA